MGWSRCRRGGWCGLPRCLGRLQLRPPCARLEPRSDNAEHRLKRVSVSLQHRRMIVLKSIGIENMNWNWNIEYWNVTLIEIGNAI